MSKCDISITKNFTIQPAAYNTIHPSLTLTIKNKELGRLDIKVMNELLSLMNSLFQLQIAADTFQFEEIQSKGLTEYYKDTIGNLKEIKADVLTAVEKLNEVEITEGE